MTTAKWRALASLHLFSALLCGLEYGSISVVVAYIWAVSATAFISCYFRENPVITLVLSNFHYLVCAAKHRCV